MTDQELGVLTLFFQFSSHATQWGILLWGRRSTDINTRWQGKMTKIGCTMTKNESPGALIFFNPHYNYITCPHLSLVTSSLVWCPLLRGRRGRKIVMGERLNNQRNVRWKNSRWCNYELQNSKKWYTKSLRANICAPAYHAVLAEG